MSFSFMKDSKHPRNSFPLSHCACKYTCEPCSAIFFFFISSNVEALLFLVKGRKTRKREETSITDRTWLYYFPSYMMLSLLISMRSTCHTSTAYAELTETGAGLFVNFAKTSLYCLDFANSLLVSLSVTPE